MNTVAQPPQSDGKQPAGEAHSSRRTSLAAPLFTRPATPSGSGGEPGIPSDDAGGAKMDDANRPGRAPEGVHSYTKSSRAASDIDPAFLAAWRETQGQPIDAEPRTS